MDVHLNNENIDKDLNQLKEKYELLREEKLLSEAKIILLELIDFCNKNNISGNYYYTLYDLESEMKQEKAPILELEIEEQLKTVINNCFIGKKVSENTLLLVNKFYEIHQNRTPEGELWLGKIYMQFGHREDCIYFYEEAQKHFLKSLQYGFNPSSYYHLARSRLKLGKIKEAEENYLEFLNYDKNTTYRGYIGLIILKSLEGKHEEAKKFLEDALTYVPTTTKSNINKLLKCARINNIQLPQIESQKEPVPYIEIESKQKNHQTEKDQRKDRNYYTTLLDENFYKEHTDQIENILSSRETISLTKIDNYISNLSVSQIEYFLLKIKVAKILSRYNFTKKALQYEREVDSVKPKTMLLKQELKRYREDKKFLKYRSNIQKTE